MGRAGKADYWHAHPQRITRGCMAIVWKGVQSKINSMILSQVIQSTTSSKKTELVIGEPIRSKLAADRMLSFFSGPDENQKPGAWDLVEYLGPELNHLRSCLHQLVQRRKRNPV